MQGGGCVMYSATFWEIFFLVAAFVFILPTLIGMVRGVDNLLLVVFLNVLAPVTVGVGWIAAMGVACFGERMLPPRRMRAQRRSRQVSSLPPAGQACPWPPAPRLGPVTDQPGGQRQQAWR